MIDYKIGETIKKESPQNTKINNEEIDKISNILEQIKYMRDFYIKKSIIAERQRRYTNIILTIMLLIMILIVTPILIKISLVLLL